MVRRYVGSTERAIVRILSEGAIQIIVRLHIDAGLSIVLIDGRSLSNICSLLVVFGGIVC
jgi:hypothetical protein